MKYLKKHFERQVKVMKVELPVRPPKELNESWPGQFQVGRWLDNIIPFPMQVFVVTTRKENGLNNAQLNSWGMTVGSGMSPYFIFSDMTSTDTYKLINKNKEFVVNIPSISIKDKVIKTTTHYGEDVDEIIESGLTPIPGIKVGAARVEECIAHYECEMEWVKNLPGGQAIICGKILAASADEKIMTGNIQENINNSNVMFYLKEPIDYFNNLKLAGKTFYGTLSSNVVEE